MRLGAELPWCNIPGASSIRGIFEEEERGGICGNYGNKVDSKRLSHLPLCGIYVISARMAEPRELRAGRACWKQNKSGMQGRERSRPQAYLSVQSKEKRLSARNLTESLWNRIGLPIPEFVIIEKRQCFADDEACAVVRQSFHDKCKEAGCRAVVDNGTSGKDKDDACDTCSEDEVVVNPEKQRIFADITLVHFAAQGAEEPENGKQSEAYVGQ